MRRDAAAIRSVRSWAPCTWLAPLLLLALPPCVSAQAARLAHYDFDELSWNGTSDEVRDTSGNAMHGTAVGGATTTAASPAIPGSSGTCRYGSFDGSNDYVRIADRAQLDLTGGVSFAAWVRHRTSSYRPWEAVLAKGDSSYRVHLNGGCSAAALNPGNPAGGVTFGLNTGCAAADLNSLQVPQAGVWYHIGATWRSGEMNVYVNGVLRNQAAFAATLAANAYDLFIGENSQRRGRYWNGDIDEVTLWPGAVSQAEIQSHMAARHACPGPAPHFVVTHDRYGIHCSSETIRVEVRDAANNPFTGYSEQITLDTQSSRGDWSLLSGGGTLADAVANDGQATYQWPAGESTAVFSLSYSEGAPTIDIDVRQTSDAAIRDDDSEGAMTFAASGFTVTSTAIGNPPGAIAPFASPQTAGAAFDVRIAAFGQTAGDPSCGVIESYDGVKSLRFWSDHVNPASGSRAVTVDGVGAATAEAAAATQDVTFSSGQARVTAKYKDVGLIRIAMKDDGYSHPDLPAGIRGSTGNVVFKPADLRLAPILRADNGATNPGASSAAGPAFIAAGAPFATSVTALDAEGSLTPNYGRENPPESVRLEPALLAPAGGTNPAVSATVGFGPFVAGAASGTDFAWPEVGIITLTARVADGSYLGAGDVAGTASGPVGRFVPNDFGASTNVPLFQTACPGGGFTYLGQPFGYALAPVVTVTARALGGATTRNYRDEFWKITNASLGSRNYSAGPITLDTSGLPPASADPAVAELGDGAGTLTFGAGSGLAVLRQSPVAPLTPQIGLSIAIVDEDGVQAATNPYVVGNAGGIGFTSGAEQRYGRLAFRNAAAPELFALRLPLRVEYYADDATGFVVNEADACTAGVSLQMAAFSGSLGAGETCVIDSGAPGASGAGCASPGAFAQRFRLPPVLGDLNLHLAPPGAGNSGSVTVRANAPSWLDFEWDASSAGWEDPAGTATFGVYQGNSQRIYQRERY